MKLQILTVRDIVADCCPFAPMYVHHLGAAIRDFGDQCRDKNTPLGKHPSDYELFHVGEWDDVENVHTLLEKKRQIAVGANYKD